MNEQVSEGGPARRGGGHRWRIAVALVATVALIAGGVALIRQGMPGANGAPIRIGAVFPLHGDAAGLAAQELLGVKIAAELVNDDGGIDGRQVTLDIRDLA